MKKLLKFKVEEVVMITRKRIVEVEADISENAIFNAKPKELSLDKEGHGYALHVLTELIRMQHSTEGDMTEQVIKATRL